MVARHRRLSHSETDYFSFDLWRLSLPTILCFGHPFDSYLNAEHRMGWYETGWHSYYINLKSICCNLHSILGVWGADVKVEFSFIAGRVRTVQRSLTDRGERWNSSVVFISPMYSFVPLARPAGDWGPRMYQIWVLSFYCLFFLDFQRRRHIILFLMRSINNCATSQWL